MALLKSAVQFICRTLGFDVRAVGASYIAFRSDGGEVYKYIAETYYWETLRRLMSANQVTAVLDVGANDGEYSLAIRGVGFEGDIVSLEPNTRLADHIRTLARDDERWRVLPVAAGDVEGRCELSIAHDEKLSSLKETTSYGEALFSNGIATMKRVDVPVCRLDRLFDDQLSHLARERLYVKLDTQGFDVEAFHGLGAMKRNVSLLQCELSFSHLYDDVPSPTEVIEILGGDGFRPVAMFPVCYDKERNRLVEADCVFINDA